MNKKRVMFVSSSGDCFNELMQLKKIFYKYDYFILTEKNKSSIELKKEHGSKTNFLISNTKLKIITYPFILISNFFINIFLYIKIRPEYIIAVGVNSVFSICIIGKIFGSKIIFIEPFSNIEHKTFNGGLIYKLANLFIVQWADMLKAYPDATYGGGIY